MPILIVLLFVVVMVFLYIRWNTTTLTRNCRWREDHSQDKDGKRYFHCVACQGVTYVPIGQTPRECKAQENR